MNSLILFDIDSTLVNTAGAGMRALSDAAKQLFGSHVTLEGISYAGRLDPLIVRDVFSLNGLERTSSRERALRDMYARHLATRLVDRSEDLALPGAIALVSATRDANFASVGVLTGNYPETGRLKLAAAGFNLSDFVICAWGDESPHDPPARDHLTLVAMRRHEERYGQAPAPYRVIVVGDTPHDVSCAKAHGCRCLAVATGHFSESELSKAGADHVVANLTNTRELLQWMQSKP